MQKEKKEGRSKFDLTKATNAATAARDAASRAGENLARVNNLTKHLLFSLGFPIYEKKGTPSDHRADLT